MTARPVSQKGSYQSTYKCTITVCTYQSDNHYFYIKFLNSPFHRFLQPFTLNSRRFEYLISSIFYSGKAESIGYFGHCHGTFNVLLICENTKHRLLQFFFLEENILFIATDVSYIFLKYFQTKAAYSPQNIPKTGNIEGERTNYMVIRQELTTWLYAIF